MGKIINPTTKESETQKYLRLKALTTPVWGPKLFVCLSKESRESKESVKRGVMYVEA